MSAPTPPVPLTPQLAEALLQQFLATLDPDSLPSQLSLRFPLQPLLPLPIPLFQISILFLLKARFPLLVAFNEHPRLLNYGLELKQRYQLALLNHKLNSPFNFDYFLLLATKLTNKFLAETFPDVLLTPQIHQQLYCLLVKALIGLNMSPQAYTLLQKKFIDPEKYNSPLVLILNDQTQNRDSCSGTKRTVTMNAIQLKLRRRKLKHKRLTERLSINMLGNHQTSLSKFKEDLQNSLRVETVRTIKKKKLYADIESSRCVTEKKETIAPSKRSQQLHTEQISAALKMKLLFRNVEHCYTRKDIVLRHSHASPNYTTYLQPQPPHPPHAQPPCSQTRNSHQSSKMLPKQTLTYWNSLKKELDTHNRSFEY